jgi:hypothetical protein
MSHCANGEPRAFPRIALSLVHVGLGLSGTAFCLPYAIAALSVDASENPGAFGFGVYLFAPLLAIYCLPSLICGAALLFDRGWAASVLRIQAFAYALVIPIGTILAIATWMALAPVANRNRPREAGAFALGANRSFMDFLFVLIGVASGFVLLLKGLFTFHEGRSPSAVEAAFPFAAIAFVASGVYFAPRLTARFRSRRRGSSASAPLAGRSASANAMSCEHIEPLLRALRHSGVAYRRCGVRQIEAECRFDIEELKKQFSITAPLVLGAVPLDERYVGEMVDVLYCGEHEIAVRAAHSAESDDGAQVFPARPASTR